MKNYKLEGEANNQITIFNAVFVTLDGDGYQVEYFLDSYLTLEDAIKGYSNARKDLIGPNDCTLYLPDDITNHIDNEEYVKIMKKTF